LVTQLTSHAISAAPTVTRVATEMSALPSGKSALLTGAIAAAAAVSVPVAAYTVREVTTPDKPAPAVAAPLEADDPAEVETPGPIDLGALDDAGELPTSTTAAGGGTSTTTTDTSIAPSALHPFERDEHAQDDEPGPATSADPSSSPSSTTTVPPPATSEVVARLTSGDLTVTGDRPNFDLSGTTTMTADQSSAGELVGRLSVYDDDTMAAELTIDVAGTQYSLRIRGTVTEVATEDGATTYHFTGRFSLPRGSDLGAPDRGDVVEGTLRIGGEGTSSLQLDLSGTDG
jgi:hypothetical protein